MQRISFILIICLAGTLIQCTRNQIEIQQKSILTFSPPQLLGKKLFFDTNLSSPVGESCASCHSPVSGFADPRKTALSEGAIRNMFGTRNTPTVAYAAFTPYFHFDSIKETYIGGLFLDGRAATLSEQAAGPFMNHLEMNNGTKEELINKIRTSAYKDLFLYVFGTSALDDIEKAFEYVNEALEEYEETMELSPFTSKFDYYLRGEVNLSDSELRGLDIFNQPEKGNCAACHPSTINEISGQVLFTDYTYDNLGIPLNMKIKQQQPNYQTDLGLGAIVHQASENGKFKVPTLRNVGLTAPYFHNGIFNTLEEVVRFYNDRDSGKFGKPEVEENMNTEELGNLKLNDKEIADLVAFLNTLSDGYQKESDLKSKK